MIVTTKNTSLGDRNSGQRTETERELAGPEVVGVAIVPVHATDETGAVKIGVVAVRHLRGQQKGMLTLPGGSLGKEDWQTGITNHLKNETTIAVDRGGTFDVFDVRSAEQGHKLFIFSVTDPIKIEKLQAMKASKRYSLSVVYDPLDLFIPAHALAVQRFLNRPAHDPAVLSQTQSLKVNELSTVTQFMLEDEARSVADRVLKAVCLQGQAPLVNHSIKREADAHGVQLSANLTNAGTTKWDAEYREETTVVSDGKAIRIDRNESPYGLETISVDGRIKYSAVRRGETNNPDTVRTAFQIVQEAAQALQKFESRPVA